MQLLCAQLFALVPCQKMLESAHCHEEKQLIVCSCGLLTAAGWSLSMLCPRTCMLIYHVDGYAAPVARQVCRFAYNGACEHLEWAWGFCLQHVVSDPGAHC